MQRYDIGSHPARGRNRLAPDSVPDAMRQLLGSLAAGVVMLGCSAAPADTGTLIDVLAVAGPTCPVVSDPPDPGCADRPVEGATIVVRDEGGAEVDRFVTDSAGEASIRLPPGTFTFEPQPVDGLMGTAAPIEVTLAEGAEPDPVVVAYDTGIR